MRTESNFIATEFRLIIERSAAHMPPEPEKTPPEELHIELEGKKLTQEDSFVYLGRALCGDGKTEKDVLLGYVRENRPERIRGEQLRG